MLIFFTHIAWKREIFWKALLNKRCLKWWSLQYALFIFSINGPKRWLHGRPLKCNLLTVRNFWTSFIFSSITGVLRTGIFFGRPFFLNFLSLINEGLGFFGFVRNVLANFYLRAGFTNFSFQYAPRTPFSAAFLTFPFTFLSWKRNLWFDKKLKEIVNN